MSTLAPHPVAPVPFAAGNRLLTPRRTIGEGDFAAIVNLTWENGPLHTDDVYMAGTRFGRRILGGPCLLALAAGLSSATMYAAWVAAGLDCTAGLGIDDVRYDAPLFVGDTIQVEILVVQLDPTTGKSAYIGAVEDTVRNQHGQSLLRMRRSYLLKPVGAAG